MSEYDSIFDDLQGAGPLAQVTSTIDASPDEAARSLELSKVNGVSPVVIAGDVPAWEKQQKSLMASAIVSKNDFIRDYVASHPLASTISNDDYGTLDTVSQGLSAIRKFTSPLANPSSDGPFHRFSEGGPIGSWALKDADKYPLTSAIFAGLGTPVELGLRGLMGTVLTATDLTKDFATKVGGESFGRDIGAMLETEAMGLSGRGHTPTAVLREAQFKSNAEGVARLQEVVDHAQTSLTKERAPELFSDFANRHMEGRQIGLSGERVAALYGDRLPEPGDGLLGWVPNIERQLEVARETGADITVPIGDWVSKVDPALAKELADDIRISQNGITGREAVGLQAEQVAEQALNEKFKPLEGETPAEKPIEGEPKQLELPFEKPVVNETLPQIRATQGLEPLFSIGDRKLTINRLPEEKQTGYFGSGQGFHDFDLVNERGQSVGTINLSEQKGGKELYVEMINGLGEYYNPNRFGPSLMRDLIRQLKAEFPNAEYLTGHRVTGARDAVGTVSGPSAMPKIKLSAPLFDMETNTAIRDLFAGSWMPLYEGAGQQLFARVRPSELMRENEHRIGDAIDAELRRIAPDLQHSLVDTIQNERGQPAAYGVFLRYDQQAPLIAVALDSPDPLGTARHEAIHHLYRGGFFKAEEWSTLQRAAETEGWAEKYKVNERYAEISHEGRLEESIADAFADWKKEFPERAKAEGFQPTLVDKVFTKLQEFFDRIKERLGKILGKEPTFEDLFKQIDEGEIGRRSARRDMGEIAYSKPPTISEPGLNAEMPFREAKDVGMTVDQYRRYGKLIEERQQADLTKAVDRVLKEQQKRQTKEWKAQSEAMRPEVVAELNARPDVAADKFFGLGEINGEKLDKTYRLDWESLTPEQRDMLPERYTVRKGGIKADDVAPLFGYQSGAQMIEALGKFDAARRESGLGRDRFMRAIADAEINRRMEREHGFLEKNIFEDAMDQIRSEHQLDLLHEETHALALMSGDKGFDLTRDQLVRPMREKFEASALKDVSSEKFDRQVAKFGRAAELALLSGKPAEAFKAKQMQYFNQIYANFAAAVEKEQARLDKRAKPYRSGKTQRIEPEFVDHIQSLLQQAGYKIKRSPEELAHSMEFHGAATLPEFVDNVASLGWDPMVSETLRANGAKPLEQMTVAEFREFKDAIDSLDHIGRETRSIIVAGERQDFAEFKEKVLENIRSLPPRSRESQGKWLYNIDASLTRMEEMMKDLDLRQELGPLWDSVIRPMALSKSKEFDMMTDLANHFHGLRKEFSVEWRKSLDESLPNDLIHDPYTNAPYDMTRGNLLQIMLNWGNRSNIDKFVNGAGAAKFGQKLTKEQSAAFEAQIKSYIDIHARKEDWEFVQQMWEPFKNWSKEMDTVARNTTGIAPAWIPPEKIQTPHGTFEGGYWPVQYDRLASGIESVKAAADGPRGIFDKQYFRAATSKGYLKERTGYVDFVNINDSIETSVKTMQQTIHDIAFRDSLMQASKVFYDKEIFNAIKKHYGSEYAGQLIPWLKRISYQFPLDDPAVKGMNDFLRRTRTNLVGHALPLNLKVILSPDIGVPNPAMWARFEANRAENTQIAMTHSAEIRHLVYNLDRDFNEALQKLTLKPGFDDFRHKAVQWGYLPVAKVSQEFRMATFVDEFNAQKAKGRTDTEAAALADSRVREQHGAASVVDLPAMMQSNEGMKMLTMFYGYFNTMYNWQRQLPGHLRRGEWKDAMTNAAGSIGVGAAFGALLFNGRKEDDSWGKIVGKALLLQPLSTIPILNVAANFAFEGFAPRMPFASVLTSFASIYSDAKKYLKGEEIKKPITHGANVVGLSTGLPLAQLGRSTQFGVDVARGKQNPRNIAEWMRGIITGEARLKK